MGTRGRTAAVIGPLAACLAVALPAPARAGTTLTPGEIVVADARAFGGGALIAVDPTTGAETVISDNDMPVNADNQLFADPFVLTIDAAGDILVANTYNMGGSCSGGCGGVIRVDPATGAETVLSSNAMAINASSQYFNQPTGITIAPDGEILVADWGGTDGLGRVIGVDPTTGKEMLISSNAMPVNASSQYFDYAQGITTDAAGDIFVSDPMAFGTGGGIIEVNPTTGKETELSANDMAVNASSQYFHSPSQITALPDGHLLVADWCETTACGAVVDVDPTTGKEALVSANSMPVNASSQYFDQPTAVAVDASDRIIEVQEAGLGGSCSGGCGGLVYVDPTTGAEQVLSANSLAVNADNQLYVEPFDAVVVPAAASPAAPSGGFGAGGGTGAGSTPGATNALAPVISALAQSHSRWWERHGTVFSFTLSQAAQVTLTFARVRGARATTVGALTLAARAGANTLAFHGRLSRSRLLRHGSYEVVVTAAGAAPRAGPLRFTILARRSR